MARSLVPFIGSLVTIHSALAASPGTSVTWLTATHGNWIDATKWSSSVYPDNGSPTPTDTYEVTLNTVGAAHTVTLQDNVAVNSVTLDSPNVTLLHSNGILTTDLITINQGIYQFGSDSVGFPSGHEIVGATIVGNGGEMRIGRREPSTHILRNVVLDIDLAVPSSGSNPYTPALTIKDGLTIAEGRTLLIEPRFAHLLASGNQTIDGQGQILFSNPNNITGSGSIVLTSGTTLTLGSELEVRATNGRGSINAESDSAVVNLVNYGLLSSSVQNWALQIFDFNPAYPTTFENWGVVEAIVQGHTIVAGQWVNNGTFRIRDSGLLELAGSYRTDELGVIDRQSGTLRLGGQMDNVGLTLTANASTGNIQLGGTGGSAQSTLIGGTLSTSDSAAFVIQNVDLQDVIVAGDVNISQNYSIDIIGDLTFDNGRLRLSSTHDLSTRASIRFPDRDILRSIRGTGTIAFTEGRVNRIFIDKELMIESGITVETQSGDGDIIGPKLNNHGTLRSLTGGTLALSLDDFVNHGVIDVAGMYWFNRTLSFELPELAS